MQEIKINYSDLRRTAQSIINIVNETSWYDRRKVSLSTTINHEMGIQGRDWDEILVRLKDRENLNLEGLNSYEYFYNERQLSGRLVINLLFLPLRVLNYMLNFALKDKGYNRPFFYKVSGNKPPITIADLVTSKIEGRFVKHKDTAFKPEFSKRKTAPRKAEVELSWR